MMSSNTSLTNFVPIARIGEGSFSSVYQVRRITDNKSYALKKIKIGNLKEKQKANALNEIRILASLNSKFIISYKEAFFDEKLRLLCIVMEWANQGDLHQLINTHKSKMTKFPEQQIWKAAFQILSGLQTLHKHSILHRDIKSANIFISDGVYKLGDLNVSKVKDDPSLLAKTQTGTPFYASPQIWRDEPYDTESDIWSFGCIIYEMCCLKPPFNGKDLSQLYKQVQRGYYQPIPKTYSRQLSNLIEKCLINRPKNRPSASQLLKDRGIVRERCQFYEICIDKSKCFQEQQLLATIKMPFDMKNLNSKLPSSKYENSEKDNARTILKASQPNYSQRPDFQGKKINRITKNQLGLPQKIKHQLNKINKVIHDNNYRQEKNNKMKPSSNEGLAQKISYLSPIKDLNIRKQRPMSCNSKAQYEGQYYINNLKRYNPSAHLKYLSDRKPFSGIQLRHQIRSDRKLFLGQGTNIAKQSYVQESSKYRCRSANNMKIFSPSPSVKQSFNYKQISTQSQIQNNINSNRYLKPKQYTKSQGTLLRSKLHTLGKANTKTKTENNSVPLKNYSHCYPNEVNYLQKVQNRMIQSGNAKLKRQEHIAVYKLRQVDSKIKKMVKDRHFYYKSSNRI